MLQLFDVNHNKICGLTNYKDIILEREINQLDALSFLYPISDDKHDLIQEECYIRTQDNEYVIKEVNYNDENYDKYVCKVNIEDISGKDVSHFEAVEQTCTDSANLALAGTEWTVGSCNVTKKRTAKKNNCTAFGVLQEIQDAFICEMTFDAVNKKVYIYEEIGADKGAYFIDQLNLKAVNQQRNSYDYITRLIPMGKDNLDITSVNNGKNYVENYQYSSKIITAYWEDNRYTVAQDLFDDATERLNYLSKPLKGYSATVYDLAKVSDKYSILDYSLGDTITLINKDRNIREKQRIVKTTEYLEEPEKNTIEIANKLASVDNLIVRFQGTSDTVDTVTTTDGSLDGSKIDGVDWTKVNNVSIGTADIQDASITTAKIGQAQITEALIADASISNAKIQNAAIDTANIKDAAITNAKIANASIDTAQIQDAAITNAKIGNASIGTANIQNAAIGTAQIAVGAITTALIATSAVGTEQVADSSITDAKIVTLTANKLTAGTIDASNIDVINLKCANLTVGQINGQQIASGAVDNTKLSNDVVTDINSRITQTQLNTAMDDIQIGGTNLVYNGHAVLGTAGWSRSTAPIVVQDWGGSLELLFDVPNSTTSENYLISDDFPLKPNTTYTISVYGTLNGSNPFTSWDIIVLGRKSGTASGGWDYIHDKSGLTNTLFTKQTFTFTTASNEVYGLIRIDNNGSTTSGTTCELYVTEIKLEEGNKATAWSASSNETQSQIDTAQATADGKNKVHYASSQPSTSGNTKGDIWFDTDDGNKMYQWNGSNWTASQFGTDAIANLSITNALIADATIQSAKIGSVDAGTITVGTLNAARIGSLSISSDKLAANSVIAGKIAANAVTAGTIAANAVTASTIVANAITGDKIAAKTITAANILLYDTTNYCDNPIFDNGSQGLWGLPPVAASSAPSGAPTNYVGHTNTRDIYGSDWFTVTPGDKFYCQMTAATLNSTYATFIGLFFVDKNHNPINWLGAGLNPTSSWTNVYGTVTVPVNAVYARIWVQISATSNYGDWYFTNVIINKQANANLIVDGCITSTKIAANTIIANNIAANTITAAQIASGTITADRLTAGTITASSACIESLKADWISTGIMAADRIRGGSLILGGGSTYGNGSEIVKDASGNNLVSLDNTGINIFNGGFSIYGGADKSSLKSLSVASNGDITLSKYISSNSTFALTVTQNAASGLVRLSDNLTNYSQFTEVAPGSVICNTNAAIESLMGADRIICNRITGASGEAMQINIGNNIDNNYCRVDTSSGIMRLYTSAVGSADYGLKLNPNGEVDVVNNNNSYALLCTNPNCIWSGTVPATGSVIITHNLGHCPIVASDGTIGNINLTYQNLNGNQLKVYNSTGNAFNGGFRLW